MEVASFILINIATTTTKFLTSVLFLAKHKKYRKALNHLNKLGAGYKLINYEKPDNIDEGVERYLALERLTWKLGNIGLQKNASHKEFYLSVIPRLTKEGRASIHFLETSEGKYIAGIVCLSFGDIIDHLQT